MNWEIILTGDFLIQILAASIAIGAPLILAALGEVFAERSGVFNLAVDGIMLLGGFAAFAAAWGTGNLWLGVVVGLAIGVLLGLTFAFWAVTLRADQVVAGFAMLILTSGAAIYAYRLLFLAASRSLPQVARFQALPVPALSELPLVGPMVFNHNALTYLLLLLVPLCSLVLFRTRFGLRATAVGEFPAAADTVGISVTLIRYVCVAVGAALAGLAGAYLSLAELGSYNDTMTGGRGFVALALVIFGGWSPVRVLAGGLLFGLIDALQVRLQFLGTPVPAQFLIMLPYVLTIVVLLIRRTREAPAAITVPYTRE